jgi:hypothetical protein
MGLYLRTIARDSSLVTLSVVAGSFEMNECGAPFQGDPDVTPLAIPLIIDKQSMHGLMEQAGRPVVPELRPDEAPIRWWIGFMRR